MYLDNSPKAKHFDGPLMFGLATPNRQVWQPISERYLDFATRLYKLAYCQLLLPIKLHRWRNRIPRLMGSDGKSGVALDDLIPDEKQIAEVRQKLERSSEVPIAEIDQDGFFLSQIGRLNNLPKISEGGFLRRKKHGLCLVATEKGIGIRKAFRGNAYGFLRELEILSVLASAGCNVPKIIGVDPETLTITISFIRGRVLREELAKKGALIRNRDMTTASKLRAMSRIREGKRFLYHVVGAKFVERLWVEL